MPDNESQTELVFSGQDAISRLNTNLSIADKLIDEHEQKQGERSGKPPPPMIRAAEIAVAYARKGHCDFETFARDTIVEAGGGVQQFLKGAWEGARRGLLARSHFIDQRIGKAMTPESEVEAFDLDALAEELEGEQRR